MSKTESFSCLHCRKPATPEELETDDIVPAWEATEGTPSPLGITWVVAEQAWNVAVYSRHAQRVILLLFDDDTSQPAFTMKFDPLSNKSGPIWHCRVPRSVCPDAKYYAWQMDGPAPAIGFDWHTFDAEKVLLDPYAKAVYFPPEFDREAALKPGSNMGHAPLGLLNACRCSDKHPSGGRIRHGSDLVIYEMHIRGFTQHPSSRVADEKRGTFAGVIEKIPHLTELGITAVELMPIFQFDPQDGDYWGYMPLNFFAPHHAYSMDPDHCAQWSEFREMVKALHDAGIEVILDVVYNHTCEGDHRGPTYGFKGIDNSTYYMVTGQPHRPYANYSGTGNTLHTANRAVRQLIVDSLRYWVTEMGVDGFRFDLASVFTRESDGSINTSDPPIFAQISSDPVLRSVRMIAEPWDAGGAYQLGRSFPGSRWMQWNARFRDTLHRFVRGDAGMVPELMTRIYGSCDLFPDDLQESFRPFQSVNYVASHDGFTINDLVSFAHKRNWANGHDNADGTDDFSWNCGWEGNENVPPEVTSLRKQQVRNFFCLLMLSNGAPMLRMGDEFMQSQHGNNNPYNQDNETAWLDWTRLSDHRDVFEFVRELIAFRKSHPTIARSRFWREDIRWFGADRLVDMSDASHSLAYFLPGLSGSEEDLYVMINSSEEPVRFGVYVGSPGQWKCQIDTSRLDSKKPANSQTLYSSDNAFDVHSRSMVVLTRRAISV